MFTIILSAINNGVNTINTFVSTAAVNFFIVLLGGLFIGILVGLLGSLISRIEKDNLILQITQSLISTYISFAVADLLGVSGVMSTLAAGIVVRNFNDEAITQKNNHYIENFWKYFCCQ